MRRFFAIAVVLLIASCGNSDSQTQVEEKKDAPLAQAKNSDDFSNSFAGFLNTYYKLKDALVASDEAMATSAASSLAGKADSLNLKQMKADTSIVEMAKGNVESISAEAKALAAAQGIEEKRKSFQVVSENMYDLIRTVRYDKETVYHVFCPMYNNDQGGYWLSASSDIKNPYFGKKMLTCGEVKDSISFSGK